MTPEALTVLLDPNRLMVAGALVGAHRTSEEVVEHTGLETKSVIAAIGELRRVGLVEHVAPSYTIRPDRLHEIANEIAETDLPMDPYIGYGMTDDEVAVLERFFSGRTLTEIPTNRPKRLIVLERLSHEFDLGRRYGETEVNATLKPFHLDVAALRRHLVDEDFLDRESGEYLRSGGRTG